MKKYVIYSAIIGAYDTIIQPSVVDDAFDYVLFSDCITDKQIGVWKVRPIDFTHPVQTKIARYIKTHPHTLLPEYECSIWIDASISITSDYLYARIKELHANQVLIAALHHPDRDCIYDEAVANMMYNFETEDMVFRWVKYLQTNHYPEHNGLVETGILFRAQTKTVSQLNEDWWRCIDSYSRRDQLSFNYVIWKNHLHYEYIFPADILIRHCEHVALVHHAKDPNRDAYNNISKPILLRIVDYLPQYDTIIRNTYSAAVHSNHPRILITKCILRLYPIYYINCIYKRLKRKIKKIIRK